MGGLFMIIFGVLGIVSFFMGAIGPGIGFMALAWVSIMLAEA
jgi:hypothetical protein